MSDRRPSRLLRLPAVSERVGLGQALIPRMAREGLFPRPVKISKRATGWLESEVEAFIEQRVAERDLV